MKNLEIIKEGESIIAKIDNKNIGVLIISSVFVDESEYMGGYTYSLIESVEVEKEYRRKGIYTKMINKLIECLQENEFIVSMGRSNDAGYFWSKYLGISEEVSEIAIEKDQQENVILIDKYRNYEIKEVRDFMNIDFF